MQYAYRLIRLGISTIHGVLFSFHIIVPRHEKLSVLGCFGRDITPFGGVGFADQSRLSRFVSFNNRVCVCYMTNIDSIIKKNQKKTGLSKCCTCVFFNDNLHILSNCGIIIIEELLHPCNFLWVSNCRSQKGIED